ncbi:hypothetical protein E2C01_091588 [Portunus trituberculatus]|uniref:Uncharacterized protein n=1 Tax=Portunus trituberculatus TaxID=210409 RepID=A0A5B7JVF5_PORTR|nr:hypothetical protein [Portunus trituberculatus]
MYFTSFLYPLTSPQLYPLLTICRYWYNNGCLYPEMASVFLPVDDCDRENSCLQVIHGSHRLGRVDHYRAGDQMRADDERVQEVSG